MNFTHEEKLKKCIHCFLLPHIGHLYIWATLKTNLLSFDNYLYTFPTGILRDVSEMMPNLIKLAIKNKAHKLGVLLCYPDFPWLYNTLASVSGDCHLIWQLICPYSLGKDVQCFLDFVTGCWNIKYVHIIESLWLHCL